MLEIKNLERRWLKYKIKSYAPYIFGIFMTLFLLSFLPYLWVDSKKSNPSLKINSSLLISEKKPVVAKVEKTDIPTVLEPSMNFMQTFQSPPPITPIIPTALVPQTLKPIQQTVPIPKVLSVPESTPMKIPVVTLPPLSKGKSLSLNRNESLSEIESVERRFKETSNPSLGLFLARYYYDHANYNEAYNLALKINSINNKIDESWIIFSKSLVKLGKAEQAKKTLQVYISESNSEQARSLLDSIERGSFK